MALGTAPLGVSPLGTVDGATTPTGNITLNPGSGTASSTGQTPTLTAGASIAPGSGTAPGTGQAPTVAAGIALTPSSGSATGTGEQPTIAAGATVALGSGTATATGHAPGVTAGASLQPGSGAATGTGQAPSVTAGGRSRSGHWRSVRSWATADRYGGSLGCDRPDTGRRNVHGYGRSAKRSSWNWAYTKQWNGNRNGRATDRYGYGTTPD